MNKLMGSIIVAFALMTTVATQAWAEIDTAHRQGEDWVSDKWVVDVIEEATVQATVNGQVTDGDRLRVRFVKGNCEVGNLLTTVLTYSDHPEISELENKFVEAIFMGQQYTLLILFTVPFEEVSEYMRNTHSSWIDLGWVPIDALKIGLSERENISLKFINSDKLIITDYFDILENEWSNAGLSDALDRASAICKDL